MANYLATHHPVPHAPLRVFPVRKPGSHPGKGNGGTGTTGGNTWSDPVLQTSSSLSSSATGGAQFDGIASDGYVPPDTNIAVGDNQIVETVNVNYAVYDKSGNLVNNQAPAPISSVFAAAGGSSMCSQVDGGDPIVLYDKFDNRWIISQLAYNVSFNNNHICMAISTGPDATGSYAVYDVPFGQTLPDYPKMGIWTTGSTWNNSSPEAGVYFSANMFSHGSKFIGAQMCGFPLNDVANTPSKITWICAQNGTGVFSILPADQDGLNGPTLPAPAGMQEYFLQFSGSNILALYQFNLTTGLVTSLPNITVADFHEACGGACVPQLNTSTQLDSLGDRLMYRLSYRNYGSSNSPDESPVVTHAVQMASSSSATGIRWHQLTKPNPQGNGWGVAQQGTFGSNDGNYRWMGSMAQDKFGDLGIGYSVSGPQIYPTIAYTGQTAAEAASSPGQLEQEVIPNSTLGKGAQTIFNRWGDFSSMSVDPTDECTMWFAPEYGKTTDSYYAWGTYITSFKLGSCNN